MNELKKFGVCFSLDNFGRGYFSLSCLAQMSFKQIKIDQSFVQNLNVKSTAATITQTIIGITRSLGIEVIAEGVETEAQRAFLQQHGCPMYQGYLFSQAVSLEAFEQLLHRQHSSIC
jgi:EAL domain-containing protein (putative c-di-GMP-specific phosphodiesterase class I)